MEYADPVDAHPSSAYIDSMDVEWISDLERRAALHHALGEPHRLAVVDALRLSDRSPSELRQLTELPSNLLAFHLDVLEAAGLVTRRRSEGDARRRYVTLQPGALAAVAPTVSLAAEHVVFVCTRNSARSQLAAALWERRTGLPRLSAGTAPAERVHPLAVTVGADHGLAVGDPPPRHLDDLDVVPDLVVSVCDRAREGRTSWAAPQLHWSVPDPVCGERDAFERAFAELDERVARLAAAAGAVAA